MTRWDIRPAGVQGVLNQTGTAAQPIRKHAKALNKHLNAAASGSGSDLVSAALQNFADSAGEDLAEISGRLGRAIGGTVKATRAYLDGDEEMAREAQRQAAAAPDPGLGDGEGRPMPGGPV